MRCFVAAANRRPPAVCAAGGALRAAPGGSAGRRYFGKMPRIGSPRRASAIIDATAVRHAR